MGPTVNVLAWNVRGLNFPNKRTFACDVAILQDWRLLVVR